MSISTAALLPNPTSRKIRPGIYILFIVNCLTLMHFVHALHDNALATGPTNPARHLRAVRFTSTAMETFHGSVLAKNQVAPALPFVIPDAVLTGEVQGVYSTAAVASWAGAARGLLHGKRRPSKYAWCSQCTLISCDRDRGCSGHCRKHGKLFTCRSRFNDVLPHSDDGRNSSVEPDPLGPLQSVVVSVKGPYIGCANIAGLPSGCPAEGTRGFNDERMLEYTVLSSSCRQHLYNVTKDQTLFYPFGLCNCVTGYEDGDPARVPCYLPELEYTAPRRQDTDGVPVWVFSEGNMTVTTYGVREPHDQRVLMLDNVFEVGLASVRVEMEVWEAYVGVGTNFVLEGPLEDYK